MTSSVSDHSRIMVESSAIFSDASAVFSKFSSILECNFSWQAQFWGRWRVRPVAPWNVNVVSYVIFVTDRTMTFCGRHAIW